MSLRGVLLAALVTLGVAVISSTAGRSIPCTSPSCDGPVTIGWSGTDSCSPEGYPVAHPMFPDSWTSGQCNNESSRDLSWAFEHSKTTPLLHGFQTSTKIHQRSQQSVSARMWDCSTWNSRLLVRTYFQSNCNGMADVTDIMNTGVCFNTTALNGGYPESQMVLCSIKDKIYPPTSMPPPVPAPSINFNSIRTCPPNQRCGFAWYTEYSDADCSQPWQSTSFPTNTTSGQPIQLDTCYAQLNERGVPYSNMAYSCVDGGLTVSQYPSGCSGRSYSTERIITNRCMNLYGFYRMYFCGN